MMAGGAQVAVEGDARVVKIGDKVLPDFIKEWSASDEAKHFISAPANNGGGAPGGKGGASGVKIMAEGDFNAMGPKARSAFMADGGQVTAAA